MALGNARRAPRPTEVWPSARRPWAAAWRERDRAARESIAFVASGWATTLLVWALIGIALALPGALYVADLNLARAAGEWEGKPGFSIYFQPGIDPALPATLAARLRGEPGIAIVRLITPDEALGELHGQAGVADPAALLGALDGNPLPATIRASAALNAAPERLALIAAEMAAREGVDEVVIEKTWLERLAAIRDLARRVTWIMAALLGLGGVLISAASVRLAIAARLTEQEVLALVGADRRFIRRPFFYLGVLYGTGGGLLAAALLSAALVWLEGPLQRLFDSYGENLQLIGFDPMFLALLLASGAVLGALGAMVASFRRFQEVTIT